jgi:TatA/E family protein of Tat protein translocase
MPNIGAPELIIILVIALLILGPGKLPEVGASIGKSIREFRKASSDVQDTMNVDTSPLPATAPAAPVAAAVASAPAVAAPVAAPEAAPAPAPEAAPVAGAPEAAAPEEPVPAAPAAAAPSATEPTPGSD